MNFAKGKFSKSDSSEKFLETFPTKPAANHLTDFTPPIYNVWKQQEKSNAVGHFGNSEVRWVDNLLYLYTKLPPPIQWRHEIV